MRRRVAKAIVALRFLLVPLWIAGAVLAVVYLPPIRQVQTGSVDALLPENAQAVRAEALSKQRFPFPLIARTLVVERDEDGLPPRALGEAARTARAVREGLPDLRGLAAVVPVPNVVLDPGTRSTTILYYLYFRPEVGRATAYDLARRFARRHVDPQDDKTFVGVTGTGPATVVRGNVIVGHLAIVTAATAALVALAVGLFFRSPIAPVVSLATVGIAYLIASRVLGWLGQTLGLAVPQEVEPVIVVLLFGVVTDYSIFFLSRFRNRLQEGRARLESAELASFDVIDIVLVAGLVVALATGSLVAAKLQFFQVFGPAMAVTVLIGALIAVTLVPGMLAVGGRFVLWPRGGHPASGRDGAPAASSRSLRARMARSVVRRPQATAIGCILLLGAAATGLFRYDLANPILQSLPADAGPRRAYAAASAGFPSDGIVAPTVAVVRGPGIADNPGGLARLERRLARQPGVAAVFGPGVLPDGVEGLSENAFVAPGGDLARFLLILKGDPLDGRSVDTVRSLQSQAPAMLRGAGLGDGELLLGGDSAISAALVERTRRDLGRVAPAALAATFLVLALFLRSLVAPFYLIAASVLALLGALGLSAYLFGPLFDPGAIPFLVPFAASILLLALGSDYNVFLAGRIWDRARQLPLGEAVAVAGARASRPITTAGLILAASFALLALVPLATFRAVALTMALGLLLDIFLVRQFLVPALVVLVGRRSEWPGHRLEHQPGERDEGQGETRGIG